jgi:hypothetical protein
MRVRGAAEIVRTGFAAEALPFKLLSADSAVSRCRSWLAKFRQLRSQGAKELTAANNVCRKWLQAFRGAWLKGGAEMKNVPSRIRIPFVAGSCCC